MLWGSGQIKARTIISLLRLWNSGVKFPDRTHLFPLGFIFNPEHFALGEDFNHMTSLVVLWGQRSKNTGVLPRPAYYRACCLGLSCLGSGKRTGELLIVRILPICLSQDACRRATAWPCGEINNYLEKTHLTPGRSGIQQTVGLVRNMEIMVDDVSKHLA